MSELTNRLRKIQEQGMSLRDLEEKSRIDGTIMASKSAIREVINNPVRKLRITTLLGIAKIISHFGNDFLKWDMILAFLKKVKRGLGLRRSHSYGR